MQLGDLTAQALAVVGLTPDRVEAWLGGECGCEERKQKLNALGFWVRRVLSGRTERAAEHLDTILQEQP